MMDNIEEINFVFEQLYSTLNLYTKSKYNEKVKKELKKVKQQILELSLKESVDTNKIIKSIEPKIMMLE